MPKRCSRSPPSAARRASCSACRSTWTASEGPRAQSTRAFARNFAKLTALPIGLWDERLSTAAVERDLIAADMSRAQARAEVIDQHAAAFILQGALDRLARLRSDRADMLAVLAALLPVFLLIVTGFAAAPLADSTRTRTGSGSSGSSTT